jgi:DHA1 family bicyclomycin/chloramphenicol resistance-like MFS transporter
MYLPAFPAVQMDLRTTETLIQLTLTATMVGFGLGQLVAGPLSDSLGRRRPLLVATAIHVLSSVSILFAHDVTSLMIGRVGQGLGAAGSAVVAVAMVRDMFGGQSLVRMLARMALVSGTAPVVAPLAGAAILSFAPWRGIFIALVIYGALMTITAALFLRETHDRDRRGRLNASAMRRRYRVLFHDPVFLGVALVSGMTFSALFAYLSASSFILQDQYGFSTPQFAMTFGLNSVGLIVFTQTGARLMRRWPPRTVMAIGVSIVSLGALSLLILGVTGVGMPWLLVALFFTVAPLGLILPTAQILALNDHPNEAGTAASLLGALNFAVAGSISPLVSVLGISVTSMATVMVGSMVLANASFWLVVRRRASADVLR